MKYVIAGNAVADCINYADGSSAGFRPGGATLFALTGFQLYTDKVMMVGGFGEDYMDQMGEYLARNPNVITEGFNVRDPHHPINYMYYQNEGDWTSETVYGNAHYDNLCCNPFEDHMEDFLEDCDAVATFRGEDPKFFEEIFALQDRFGFRFGWEIRGNMCVPEKLELIKEILQRTQAFSLNRAEAFTLFSVDNDTDAINALHGLNVPVIIYRVGGDGLYVLMDGKALHAPSFMKYSVTDVTGCGNTSTAAGFYAFFEGMDHWQIAAHANVAAAHNLRGYGAMDLSEEIRSAAAEDLKAYLDELRSTSRLF